MTQLTPSRVLAGLRDIAGITGSFVVSPEGGLYARDLPAMFNDELIEEVAPRVLRLCDGFSTEGQTVLWGTVRFADHLLFVRPMAFGVICVLAALEINMPALKMGVNLAARRLIPFWDASAGGVYPASPPTPPPLTPGPRDHQPQGGGEGQTQTGVRRWRGSVIP